VKFLQSSLTTRNAFQMLKLADIYSLDGLQTACWKLIDKDFYRCAFNANDEMKTLDQHLMRQLLQRDTLNVKDIDLFKLLMDWARKRCDSLKIPTTPENLLSSSVIDNMIYLIRFPTMTLEELTDASCEGLLDEQQFSKIVKFISEGIVDDDLAFNHQPRVTFEEDVIVIEPETTEPNKKKKVKRHHSSS